MIMCSTTVLVIIVISSVGVAEAMPFIFLSRNNRKKTSKLQSILVQPFLVGRDISRQLASVNGIVMKNQAEEIPSSGITNSPATNEDIASVEETNTPIRHRHHRRNRKNHEENHSHHKNHNKHHGIRTRYGLWHKSPKWNRPFDTLASNIIGKK